MNIKILKSEEDINKASQLIQKTIYDSFSDLFPKILLDEWVKKYDYDNLKDRIKSIDYLIAKKLDQIVGIIGLKGNVIRTFYVDFDYQKQGIGRKLYDKIELIAKDRGFKKLIVEGGPKGEPAYLKFGFKKVKIINKERVGIKYTDILMEKEL